MKKIWLSLFLIICMLVTLVACVDPEENPDGTPYDPKNPNGSTVSSTAGGTGSGPQLGGDDSDGGSFGPIIPAD